MGFGWGANGGCAQPAPSRYYVLPLQADDVQIITLGLRYKHEISGYTFKYSQRDDCDFNVAAFVDKDKLVGAWRANPPGWVGAWTSP